MLYLLLVAVALVVGYLGYRRSHAPIFIATVIGMAASLGVTDVLIAGILRLFIYRPYLAPTASQDHPLGFFLADFVSVPLLYAGLTALFARRRVWVAFGLAGLLAAIEYGFLVAGVFFHEAWSTWFTLVLFALRFLLAAWWVPWLERVGYTRLFRAFLNMMTTYFVWLAWAVWISSILRVWVIIPGLLEARNSDRVLGMTLYHGLPFAVIGFLAVWLGWGRTVWGWLVSALLFSGYLLWLDGSGLWQRAPAWGPVVEGVALTLLMGAAAYIDRWFEASLPTRRKRRVKGG